MATSRSNSALRELRTLFSVGSVGDRADGELLEWFAVHRAEAEVAFGELVARHGPMVLDVCRRVLRDPQDVDDAFQATFLVLVRRAGSVRDRDALGGWLHRVALRVALRAKTEASRRCEVERQAVRPATSDPNPDAMERADIRAALHEELDRIPSPYRAALVACYLEGLSHEEAASRLRWPVGTVRSRLARGRDRLRRRLTRRGFAPTVTLPAPALRPELVATCLQERATQSMYSSVAGHSLAGQVSAPVAALSERVIRAMNLRTLRIVAAVAITVGAIGGTLPFLTISVLRHASAAQQPAPPGSLAGVVRDSDGRPVAGATVVAGAFTDKANHEIATTGADGRFAFPAKEGERKLAYVLAYKEGLAPASKFHGLGEKSPPTGDMELVLIKSEPFVGIVRKRDGSAVAGARVQVRYMRSKGGKYDHNPILENVVQGTPLAALFHTTTDKQGRFRFPAVPSPQRVLLNVSADGMADYTTEVPGDYEAGYISGSDAKPARLTMESEARVKGRVVNKFPGPSIVGLKVALQSTSDSVQFWRTAKTDSAGRFEFVGLPEGGGNIFLVEHPNDGPWTYRAIDNLSLHPGKTSEVTIELIEGVLVDGKVVEIGTGDPVPGIFIGMYGPARPDSGAAIMSTKTDAKGLYHFRLPPGKTRFYTAGGPPWSYAGRDVVIPDDANTFSVPDLKVKKEKPAAPAPNVAAAEAPRDQIVAAEKPIAKDLRPFQGTWSFDACESVLWYTDLELIRKSWRWEIRGQEITWTRHGKEAVKLSFTVDTSKSPNQIDLTFLDGPDKGKTCTGIYYFVRGNLWICTTEPGAMVDRPTKMAMSSDSKTAILVLVQKEPNATVSVAGLVRDVSDDPIGGATVVAALINQGKRIDRQVITTSPDGRFALKLTGPKDSKTVAKVYALKEGLAPSGVSDPESPDALTLVLPRTRPFACIVQDHDEKPIAGADAWVQSVNAPVPEGQGMRVTEFSRPALEGTPIEGALRGTSDEKGLFRLPSMPARSQVSLVVEAKGMRTHRTTDFTLPEMTGRWPTQFDHGFLHGDLDWPSTIYLDPGTEAKTFQQGRHDDADSPDHDALTKTGGVAPDFEVTTLEGKRVRLSDLKGKVVLINFFATWCGPCLGELPKLEREIWKPNQKRGLIVLAIGREHTQTELTEFLREHKLSFSIGPDPKRAIFEQYATQSIPRNYVIGPDGRIAHQSLGYSQARFQGLIEAVEKELDALTKKGDG
ncbi:MAG: sigma-70 family RNA polymerase sigma factor [Isosphaeraceae bacterium]|nr:sigma-70 family RNA polymerase sigma factor [Isosphaeraceae bacterium]